MATTFNGVLSPDTFDHGAAADQRDVSDWEARQARWARAEAWVARHFAGLTFHSLDVLQRVALNYYETTIGGAASDDHRRVLEAACRNIWCGLTDRSRIVTKIGDNGRIDYLTFTNAA